MDHAIHVSRSKEKTEYAYFEFEALDKNEREKLKPGLQCLCTAKSTFANASTSGAHAHFRLRKKIEHEKDCGIVKFERSDLYKKKRNEEKAIIEEIEKIKNNSHIIELTESAGVSYEDTELAVVDKQTGQQNKNKTTKVTSTHTIDSKLTNSSKKSLLKILKFCLTSSAFLSNEKMIVKYADYSYKVKDSFINFFATPKVNNLKRPYFFWGRIKGVSNCLTYLYVGSNDKATVIISNKIKKELMNGLKVDKYWQLTNANMICFGWLKKNSKTGKTTIVVDSLSNVSFVGIAPNKDFLPITDAVPEHKNEGDGNNPDRKTTIELTDWSSDSNNESEEKQPAAPSTIHKMNLETLNRITPQNQPDSKNVIDLPPNIQEKSIEKHVNTTVQSNDQPTETEIGFFAKIVKFFSKR
jgi:hypothetical protein